MGCYRLTYHYEPQLFLQEQGEKNYTLEWHVWQNTSSTFGDAGDKVLNSGAPSWFKDEQGKFLFDHWMGGSGKDLTYVNGSWGNYMRTNSAVMGQLAGVIDADLSTRTQSGYFSYTIDGDTGFNDYETGYGLLHGTSNYNIQGWATNNGDGTFTYSTIATWSDRIDPNYQYVGDYVAAPLYLLGAKDYNISISWSGNYTLTK